ncbi:MAG: M1 family metallopeptidase [Sphingomonadales bacterium]
MKFLKAIAILVVLGGTYWGAQIYRSATAEAVVPLGPLPKDVTPTHYDLALTIVPDQERFSGAVRIAVEVLKPTDLIWLHGDEIDVAEAAVVDDAGERIAITYSQADPTGVARLDLERTIAAGPATLEFRFSAPFNTRLEGLYRVDEGGNSYAFTQMQATSARLAFPGFDEPAFKVPFDVTLTVPVGQTAIANTPVAEETRLGNGLKQVRFATSRPMPTELLAWAVGELDVVEWQPLPATGLRDHEVPLRGITAKGKGGKIRYALENTNAIVNTLEDYFGIPYPYAKLDIIAVPDFAAGAMENIGAITYREQLVLFEEQASLGQRRRYAGVHAHELAHQWFGDLVTPKWWNDIWLNEAFATWMAARATHAWQPEQQFDRAFRRSVLGVMAQDSLQSTRQVRQPVENNHGIASAFDGITYRKGGGVIAMFERYLGAEKFRAGVHHHMSRFAHNTATSKDFMESLAQGSGDESVVAAFSSFLDQPGLPMVKAKLSCGADGAASVSLKQSRYLRLGSRPAGEQQWQIPVCLAYEADGAHHQQCVLLKDGEQTVSLETPACPSSLLPNADGAGYYRWSLDDEGWAALLGSLDRYSATEALSAADSLKAAVQAGDIDAGLYLDLARNFASSKNWDVAVAPMGMLRFIGEYMTASENEADLLDLYRSLYQPKLERLGLTPDSAFDKQDPIAAALLRSTVVDFLAFDAKLPGLRAELAGLGAAYVGFEGDGNIHPDVIIPDLVGIALAVATQEKGEPFVDALIAAIKNSSDAIFRQRAVVAISKVVDPAAAAKVRALMLSPDIRDNEAIVIFFVQSGIAENRDALWAWTQENFNAVLDRVPAWRQGGLANVGSGFCSAGKRAEINGFFAPRADDLEGGPRALAQTLEQIELCTALVDRQRGAVAGYFASH